jgi:hypothetical protein
MGKGRNGLIFYFLWMVSLEFTQIGLDRGGKDLLLA